MEQLSIQSFLVNGHPYHLYVYGDVRGAPDGTILEDANEILPESMIFKYRHIDSYAGFANYFRYKLLLERGGWWADSDVVCLRPFLFEREHVFAGQMSDEAVEVTASCVIRVPPDSAVMKFAWAECLSRDPARISWGETGPILLQDALLRFGLERYRESYRTFCPIVHQQWQTLIEPDGKLPGEDSRAIHLWHELWRRSRTDKNGHFPESSIYEALKRMYLVPERAGSEK